MKKFTTFAAAALIALAGLVAPAFAHSVLDSSVPAADASTPSPDAIELNFSETVDATFSTVTLLGADGAELALGDVAVSEDKHALSVPVTAELASGAYTVKWALVSQDGHRVEGEFVFTVE